MNILETKNLNKTFAVERGILLSKTGSVRALDGVSFEVDEGKVLGVIGESGSGKTTLARVLCRLMEPDSGEILISGKNIGEYSRRELSHQVQMIFQDPFTSLNPKLTVGTILAEALDDRSDASNKIREILSTVGLPPDISTSYPHQFSGGQRQRIAIARSLLKNPRIIIADEPLSSLDVSVQSQILKLFRDLRAKLGLTFIFISHDISTTASFADYTIVMKNGRIVDRGETRDIISAPQDDYTKKLINSVPRILQSAKVKEHK